MIEVKINFEVSLSEATLNGLKEILLTATVPALVGKFPPHVVTEVIKESLKACKPDCEAGEETVKAEAEATPAPEEKPAKTPKKQQKAEAPKEIADLELFEAVKAAQKSRGVAPDTVRGVFKEFGITTSSECPQERRAELMERINAL